MNSFTRAASALSPLVMLLWGCNLPGMLDATHIDQNQHLAQYSDEQGPEPDPWKTCSFTGGTWLNDTCGHWKCGEQPACDAIIPGCDCGEGRTYVPFEGCQDDPSCGGQEPDPWKTCSWTGGEWLSDTCGHWVCGEEPFCDAIIPGCNCGEGRTYVPYQGCVDDASCAGCNPCDLLPGGWVNTELVQITCLYGYVEIDFEGATCANCTVGICEGT